MVRGTESTQLKQTTMDMFFRHTKCNTCFNHITNGIGDLEGYNCFFKLNPISCGAYLEIVINKKGVRILNS